MSSLDERFRNNVRIVGSATRVRSRREDEIDAGHLRAPSNKELAASRPNPTGERGLLYSLQAVAGLGACPSRRPQFSPFVTQVP